MHVSPFRLIRLACGLALIMISLSATSYAQPINGERVDIGNFEALINADGCHFIDTAYVGQYIWPKTNTPANERRPTYGFNLWFGGLDQQLDLHVAAQTYRQGGLEFYPGPVMENGGYSAATDQAWNRVWKVSLSEIEQFWDDFQQNQINFANYPIIQDWPAHGDTSIGEPWALAPFRDQNNDGVYNPMDGDYPAINGDQAIWFIYNDDRGPHNETNGEKIGIEVHGMAYAFDCADSNMHDILYFDYKIINKSGNSYSNFIVGAWQDSDLGEVFDDYVGTEQIRDMFFTYNGDPNDDGAFGYGLNPPAFGMRFLDQPLGSSISYNNNFNATGNPETPGHYYNYLKAIWKDSLPLVDNGLNGYSGTASGPSTDFIYPGDPGWCSLQGGNGLWSEVSAASQPGDRRILGNTTPQVFQPGEVITLNVAAITARGLYNAQFGSVCELQTLSDIAKNAWLTQTTPCGTNFLAVPAYKDAEQVRVDLFPNPSEGAVTVTYRDLKQRPEAIEVLDLAGKVVQRVDQPQAGQTVLGREGLAEGLYMVRVVTRKGSVVKKWMLR